MEVEEGNAHASEKSALLGRLPRHSYACINNCPTCRGTGRVPRDEANRLVALIPLNDQRLTPSKTLQYVLLSMLICLVISGLLIFFMFPRSVLVSNGDIESVYVFFSENSNTVIMNVTTGIVIENSNYYPIDLYSTCIQVEFGHNVLNKTCFEKGLVVNSHSQGQVRLSIILSIFGIYEYCTKPTIKVHNVFFKLHTTAVMDVLNNHQQKSTVDDFRYFDCGANVTHPVPIHMKSWLPKPY